MKIYITKNYEELSKKAANLMISQVNLFPKSVLGLATGSSPIGAYQYIAEKYKQGDVDFTHVKAVNLDEYFGLGADSSNSYHYFMKDVFFNHININLDNTYIPNGLEKNIEYECERYDKVIEDLGGIDLQLLGIGTNGHIAFNEPDDIFSAKTSYVDLTESTIESNTIHFEKKSDVPTTAYTMGIETIMKSRKILLVANGKAKAEIMKEVIEGPITPAVPGSILQLHPDVTFVLDEEASSRLSK